MQKYDYNVPHLTNLNEDQMLCYKIYHNFEGKEILKIGKGSKEYETDILIRGIGMQEKHAIISREEDKFYIQPGCVEASEFMCLNGNQV